MVPSIKDLVLDSPLLLKTLTPESLNWYRWLVLVQVDILFDVSTGKEAIAAGSFLPSTLCLLHGKLSSAGLDVWVKSNSSVLTESFSKEVLTALGVS